MSAATVETPPTPVCGVCAGPAGTLRAPISAMHEHGRVLVWSWKPICAVCQRVSYLEDYARRTAHAVHVLRVERGTP